MIRSFSARPLRRLLRAGFGGLVLAGALAGCSGDGMRNESLWDELFAQGRQSLAPAPPTVEAPELTPEQLAGVTVPLLRSTRLSTNTSGTQYGAVVRRQEGEEQITWAGADAVTFATRGGLLVGVRGSSDDLMWADVADTLRALARGGGDARRRYMFLQGNARPFPVDMHCTIRALGPEVLSIVAQRRTTQRFEELCRMGEVGIRNLYWRDARNGMIWKSEQWAGFETGYLLFERIIR